MNVPAPPIVPDPTTTCHPPVKFEGWIDECMGKAAGVHDLRMGNEKVVSLLVGGGVVPLERGPDQARTNFAQVRGVSCRGVSRRGVAWRGVAWHGVAWRRRPSPECLTRT